MTNKNQNNLLKYQNKTFQHFFSEFPSPPPLFLSEIVHWIQPDFCRLLVIPKLHFPVNRLFLKKVSLAAHLHSILSVWVLHYQSTEKALVLCLVRGGKISLRKKQGGKDALKWKEKRNQPVETERKKGKKAIGWDWRWFFFFLFFQWETEREKTGDRSERKLYKDGATFR